MKEYMVQSAFADVWLNLSGPYYQVDGARDQVSDCRKFNRNTTYRIVSREVTDWEVVDE